MKKFLIGTLGIVVLAVVAALVAPSFIDWNAYRAEIATEVRKATGRRLVIEGPIDVALLPTPKLSAAKVRLANLEGAAAPDMVRLEALDVRVAFWPLLSGKAVVNSIELKGADIELEALADGRVNWELGPERRPGAPAAAPDASAGGSDAVRLEQVVISNGRVTWRDSRKGTVERIEKIDARLAAETLSGPFMLRGRATARGIPLAVAARTGRIEAGRPTSVNAEIELQDARAKAVVAGTFTTGDVAAANVRIEASGEDLGQAVAALAGGGAGPALLKQKFALTAAVVGDAKSVTVNDVTLSLNGTRATGALSASLGTVPVVDATFGINTLDLDAWLAAAATAPRGTAAPTAPGAQKGADAGAAKAEPFALPKDLRLALDARIGGITYNKGAIREVNLQGKLEGGVFQVTRLSAQLPGGTDAVLAGRIAPKDGAPRFDGRVDASMADARQFLDWLKVDHSAIAPDRLHRLSLKSGIGLASDRFEASDIDLRFDDTRVGGGLVVALRERLGVGANLLIDRINLDAYLAEPKDAKAGGGPAAAAGAAGARNGKGGGLATLGTFDANVRAEAQSVTFRGVALGGIALDSSLVGGDLTVKRFTVANLAGGTLDLSGKIAALDKDPVPDLRFALATKRPEQLFALVGFESPVAPAKLAPLSLDGAFKADAKTTQVKADLAAGALKAAVAGTLADLATAPRLGLDLKANHPSFLEFVRLFDPAFTPKSAPKGPFSLSARADAAGLDLKLGDIKAQLGEANVTGNATVALAADRPKVTAAFKGGTIVADHFVPASLGGEPRAAPARVGIPGPGPGGPSTGAPWSDAPLDLEGLRALDADVRVEAKSLLWQSWQVDAPQIEMALKDGRFDLRRITGKTVGGTFKLSGVLAAPPKKGGPAELSADLDVARADLRKAMFNLSTLDIASGTVTFRTSFAGKGVSSRALVASLDGGGSLEAVDGSISGFDLRRVNEQLKNLNEPVSFLTLLQTAMSGGTTKFSALKGTFKIAKGVVRSDDITLKADGGDGTATLAADLPKWEINSNATFRLSGHRDAPPFRMQLTGALDSPRRIFNLNELQAWLVSRGVGGLMEKLLKKDKQPSGQGTAPAPAAPPQGPGSTQQQQQPTTDEFIRGIFDLLNKDKRK